MRLPDFSLALRCFQIETRRFRNPNCHIQVYIAELSNFVLNKARETRGLCGVYICTCNLWSLIYVIVTRESKLCTILLHYIEFPHHDELHDAEWRYA